MSSFWRNFRHQQHRKLSFWQLSGQLVRKISSKWQSLLTAPKVVILTIFGQLVTQISSFSVVSQHWYGVCCWYPSSWKTRKRLPYIINIVYVDYLATAFDIAQWSHSRDNHRLQYIKRWWHLRSLVIVPLIHIGQGVKLYHIYLLDKSAVDHKYVVSDDLPRKEAAKHNADHIRSFLSWPFLSALAQRSERGKQDLVDQLFRRYEEELVHNDSIAPVDLCHAHIVIKKIWVL